MNRRKKGNEKKGGNYRVKDSKRKRPHRMRKERRKERKISAEIFRRGNYILNSRSFNVFCRIDLVCFRLSCYNYYMNSYCFIVRDVKLMNK